MTSTFWPSALVLILALALPLLPAAAQDSPAVTLSSPVIVVGHDDAITATLHPAACNDPELALYAPVDETQTLVDGNLTEALRLAVAGEQVTIASSDLAGWAGHRLYARVEGADCDPGAWAVVDIAYVSDADNALAPATVRFPAELLDIPVSNPPGATLGVFMGTISALVDGQLCTSVDVGEARPAGEDAYLRLGQPGQPEACRTAGARIAFRASLFTADADSPLNEEMDLLLGVTQTLRNFGTAPPESGSTNDAQDTPGPPQAGLGTFEDAQHEPVPASPSPPAMRSGGRAGWWLGARALFVVVAAFTLAVRGVRNPPRP